MNDFEEHLKANGWKPGLWNDPWNKTFVSEAVRRSAIRKHKSFWSFFRKHKK